jgi:hypothetical protein
LAWVKVEAAGEIASNLTKINFHGINKPCDFGHIATKRGLAESTLLAA